MEHRWGGRISVDVPVKIRWKANGVADARLLNVSRSGALIQTRVPLPLLARIEVYIDGGTISSFVTRIDKAGVGVEWCELSSKLVGTLLRSMPAPGSDLTTYHAA